MDHSEPLIDLENGTSIRTESGRVRQSAGRAVFNFSIGLAFFAMFGALAFGGYWQFKRSKHLSAENSAFVEVKVIDPSGRPLAGAKVFELDQLVGTTDSFGEWSRFGRYSLGQVLTFRVVYRSKGRLLEATKNFAMPLTSESQVRFKTILQLIDPNQSVENNPSLAGIAHDATAAEKDAIASIAAVKSDENTGTARSDEGQAETVSNQPTSEEDSKQATKAISVESDSKVYLRSAGRVSKEGLEKLEDFKVHIFPKIQAYVSARSTSLAPDWKVSAQFLNSTNADNLVVMRIEDREGKTVVGALRSLGSTPKQSMATLQPAIDWIFSSKQQIKPARPEWQKQQLTILGGILESDEVYVGGYLATPGNSKGGFHYFGESYKALNVTVVRNDGIAGRGRIVNRTWGNPAVFSLPGGNVAVR